MIESLEGKRIEATTARKKEKLGFEKTREMGRAGVAVERLN